MKVTDIKDATATRGETLLKVWLTDFREWPQPLFDLAFLGDKWPAIDYYVELREVEQSTPYFFAQAKATRTALSTGVTISAKKKDIELLLQIPGPTYIFGIHEPSHRVFVRSIHQGTPVKGITRILLSNELTREKIQVLHQEVQDFWRTNGRKPTTSEFA